MSKLMDRFVKRTKRDMSDFVAPPRREKKGAQQRAADAADANRCFHGKLPPDDTLYRAELRHREYPFNFLRPPYTQPTHNKEPLEFFIEQIDTVNTLTPLWDVLEKYKGRESVKRNYWSFYVRLFGTTAEGHNVCCYLSGFHPHIYIEVPHDWNDAHVEQWIEALEEETGLDKLSWNVAQWQLVWRKNIYGFTKDTPIRMLKLAFKNMSTKRKVCDLLRSEPKSDFDAPPPDRTRVPPQRYKYHGAPQHRFWLYDLNVSEPQQLLNETGIGGCRWVRLEGGAYEFHNMAHVLPHERRSRAQIDIDAPYGTVHVLHERKDVPPLLIYSLDSEVMRGARDRVFPKSHVAGDEQFQWGGSVMRFGDEFEHIPLFSAVHCVRPTDNLQPDKMHVNEYADERSMLAAYLRFFRDAVNPSVVIGYNTYGFDYKYWEDRAKRCLTSAHSERNLPYKYGAYERGLFEYGIVRGELSESRESYGGSKAHGSRETCQIAMAGRTQIDLFKWAAEEWKMPRTLNWVGEDTFANASLGDSSLCKDDFCKLELPFYVLHDKYVGTARDRGEIAEYCLPGDTLILLSCGTSVKIQDLYARKDQQEICVPSISDVQRTLRFHSQVTRIIKQPQKRICIDMTLLDGRVLSCTEDHKVLVIPQGFSTIFANTHQKKWTDYAVWKEARHVCLTDRVISSMLPVIEPISNTENASNDMFFGFKNMEILCAFSRLCGALISDGTIDGRAQGRFFLGDRIDAEQILEDIEKVCGVYSDSICSKEIHHSSTVLGNTFFVYLPTALGKRMMEEGVNCGRKTESGISIPFYLTKNECPLVAKREFVAALWGGDGGRICFDKRRGSLCSTPFCTHVLYNSDLSANSIKKTSKAIDWLVKTLREFDIDAKSSTQYIWQDGYHQNRPYCSENGPQAGAMDGILSAFDTSHSTKTEQEIFDVAKSVLSSKINTSAMTTAWKSAVQKKLITKDFEKWKITEKGLSRKIDLDTLQSQVKRIYLRFEVRFPTAQASLFAKNIGLRYCIDKSVTFGFASMYQGMQLQMAKTTLNYINLCSKYIDATKSTAKGRKKAFEEIFASKGSFYTNHLEKISDRNLRQYRREAQPEDDLSVLRWFVARLTGLHCKITVYDFSKMIGFDITKNSRDLPFVAFLPVVHTSVQKEAQIVYDMTVPNQSYEPNFFANGIVVHNCAVDTHVPLRIVHVKKVLLGIIEIARLTGLTMHDVINKKQMARTFAMISKYAHDRKYVIPECPQRFVRDAHLRNMMFGDGSYQGATVINPQRGYYDACVGTLDYAGLYPSIIRGFHLCYTTLVLDPKWLDDPDVEVRSIEIQSDQPGVAPYKLHWVTNTEPLLYGMLTEILNARANAKRLKKQHAGNPFLHALYDARQRALKLEANSTYGFLGAGKVGKLPMVALAASVTYHGRELIELTRDIVHREQPECRVIYGDSVTGDTPIYLLVDGRLEIVRFDCVATLLALEWTPFCATKESLEFDEHSLDVQVWSDGGFARVKRFIRHRLAPEKALMRVSTHTGIVDVTEDHSLLRAGDAHRLTPHDLIVNETELLHEREDALLLEKLGSSGDEIVGNDEAFMLGISFGAAHIDRENDQVEWRFAMAEHHTLADLREWWERCCAKALPIATECYVKDIFFVCRLQCDVPRAERAQFVRRLSTFLCDDSGVGGFYVPDAILRGNLVAAREFANGMCGGARGCGVMCGHAHSGCMWVDGKTQAAQIWLLRRRLGYNVVFVYALDRNCFRLVWNERKESKRYNDSRVLAVERLSSDGVEHVYDIETASSHFHVAPGNLVVHNTDSVMIRFPKAWSKQRVFDVSHQLADIVTREIGKSEILLEFEKIYDGYLLYLKKKYAGMKMERIDQKPHLAIKGLNPVRGDKMPLVKRISTEILNALLIDKSAQKAIECLQAALQAMVDDKLPPSEFYQEKKLTKALDEYPPNTVHVRVVRAMRERDPGTAPGAGEMVKFLVVEGPLKVNAVDYEHFMKNRTRYRLDYEYYLENLMMAALGDLLNLEGIHNDPYRLFEPYLAQARRRKMRIPSIKNFLQPSAANDKNDFVHVRGLKRGPSKMKVKKAKEQAKKER